MPAIVITLGKLIGGTLMSIFTSMLTGPMVEWAFWWLAEKLVKSSSATWDDQLLERMKKERDRAERRAENAKAAKETEDAKHE